tara:strand:- start:1082 stop:1300 length:219 start_codon:yes stop_codon:yes gene_type:complete
MRKFCSAQFSLGMQSVASVCWAIGAVLSGPASAADFLQFSAAIAWSVANAAAAKSMFEEQRVEMAGFQDNPV